MNVTTIGFVAKLTPFNPDVKLLHPIFVVSEFMIQFLIPAIKCKPVQANEHEGCEVSEDQMRNSTVVILQLMNAIADALFGGHSPDWLGEPH